MFYLLISHGDLCSNFSFSIVPQKFALYKNKKNCNVEKIFFKKTAFSQFKKNWRYRFFFEFCTMLVYGVCNIMRRKKLGITVLLFTYAAKYLVFK